MTVHKIEYSVLRPRSFDGDSFNGYRNLKLGGGASALFDAAPDDWADELMLRVRCLLVSDISGEPGSRLPYLEFSPL